MLFSQAWKQVATAWKQVEQAWTHAEQASGLDELELEPVCLSRGFISGAGFSFFRFLLRLGLGRGNCPCGSPRRKMPSMLSPYGFSQYIIYPVTDNPNQSLFSLLYRMKYTYLRRKYDTARLHPHGKIIQ